jgi:hypothetical protein
MRRGAQRKPLLIWDPCRFDEPRALLQKMYSTEDVYQFLPLKRAVILKARSLRLKDPENA